MAFQRLQAKWKNISHLLWELLGKTPETLDKEVTRAKRSRFPKLKKSVLLVGYNGQGYMGMQRNPGILTIESELFPALVKAGAIPPELETDPKKLHYQRCSRTDKGVSALRLIVSLKIVHDPSLIPLINAHLPVQIRVFAMTRVTRSFHSRRYCGERTYEYLMPSYAFAPQDNTTVQYRIDDSTMAQVNRLLQYYLGVHNYHNFTSRITYDNAAAKRNILSFQIVDKFVARTRCKTCGQAREMEFLSLKVKGRSFILHQIRKMIGLVIAVVRGSTPEATIPSAFKRGKVDILRAPALGLLLENVHFDDYNRRFGSDGSREPLEWSRYHEEIEQFKRDHIYQTIIDTEVNEVSMMHWLCYALKVHIFDREARLRHEAARKELNIFTRTETRTEESVMS